MTYRLIFISMTCCLSLLNPAETRAQFSYREEPLKSVIQDIERKTPYRFLYRESLITGVRISYEGDEKGLFPALARRIHSSGLDLKVNESRLQVLIFRQMTLGNPPAAIRVSGQVVDARSGERLPYASVTWDDEEGQFQGIAANSAGVFTINHIQNRDEVLLRADFVGYAESVIELDLTSQTIWDDVTFRLSPELALGKEIIVRPPIYYTRIDTSLRGLVDLGMFSPLGESNAVRALQVFPSVSTQAAIVDGIHIRGSGPDGFQLLLDGMTIYNTSHLFGLLDSFNSDALLRSGFYYDFTPARYPAPSGGSLNLTTKTGSLNEFRAAIGLSNTAYKGTLEGPFAAGRGSWMISGRHSYMNTVNWLNTDGLIRMGLNVERPSSLDEDLTDLGERMVRPGSFDARFHDLHGKLYLENRSGSRYIASLYAGGDRTEQRADRFFRVSNSNTFADRFNLREVATENAWSNLAGSMAWQTSMQPDGYAHSLLGFSRYATSFSKDDYEYGRRNTEADLPGIRTGPLENESSLQEIKLKQTFGIERPSASWTFGGSYRYFMSSYEEESLVRSFFAQQNRAWLLDHFVQLDLTRHRNYHLYLGSRLHYYSPGKLFRYSPRVKFRVFPGRTLSWGAGYSRNYNFLNKISLNDVTSADYWMLSTKEQPPLSVHYLSTGLYFRLSDAVYAQMEAYYKDFDNYRIHELSVQALSRTFRPIPVYFDNDAMARGVETTLRTRISKLVLTHTYTLSEMEIQNPLQNRTDNEILNSEETIRPEWDRKHQYTLTAEYPFHKNFKVNAAWVYASGSPNGLAQLNAGEPDRLEDYARFDLTLTYHRTFRSGDLTAALSFYNLFNRRNPWYRRYKAVFVEDQSPPQIGAVPVDIYDLGFQPSFKIMFNL